MTYTQARDQFSQILELLEKNDHLPVSYSAPLRAMTAKLEKLAKAEQVKNKGGK